MFAFKTFADLVLSCWVFPRLISAGAALLHLRHAQDFLLLVIIYAVAVIRSGSLSDQRILSHKGVRQQQHAPAWSSLPSRLLGGTALHIVESGVPLGAPSPSDQLADGQRGRPIVLGMFGWQIA
jgi:hypothetical protein